jgi:hypothetical protein
MKSKVIKTVFAAALPFAASLPAFAQSPEIEELKSKMKAMEQTLNETKQRLADLEKGQSGAVVKITNDLGIIVFHFPTAQVEGHASPIAPRNSLNDQQEAAPRPNDLTLDPKYNGFIPVPNTPVLIKFNAKPRLDAFVDSQNPGNVDRFVTATIPLRTDPLHGGGAHFNMNAKGSQMSLDVRAPELPGNLRFFYQNDFFGSGGSMGYRLRHLYGQFFNVTAGFTYSIFEDPDVWPDTVDYEGPNSAVFARQPTVRYLLPLSENWQLNFGIQQPAGDIDTGTTGATPHNQAPDGGVNVRWEDKKIGHVQLAGILRDLGARNTGPEGDQNVLGWGLNLSAGINVFEHDSAQAQLTYGEGIFHFANDNFMNNDAAFHNGNLEALPYLGAMAGYTHRWNEILRSTASFGYVNLDNTVEQGPDAYHKTYYSSVNLVWQLRKRLSVGFEGLYGRKEAQSGEWGDVFRAQVGLVYSLFD